MEARDLVHKIFRLLEHYEAHHQLLAEKIQLTELAAQHAAHIEPVWKDAGDATVGCNVTPACCNVSESHREPPRATDAAVTAVTAPVTTTTSIPSRPSGLLSAPTPASAATPVPGHLPAAGSAPASGQLQGTAPTDVTGHLSTSAPSQFQGTVPTDNIVLYIILFYI